MVKTFSFDKAASTELLAFTVGLAAILGLLFHYPTVSLNKAFVPNDAINLIFGIPLLLYSTHKAFLLPGALGYHIYSSLTYVLALKENPNSIFFFHLASLYMSCGELWSEYPVALERSRSLHIDTGKYLQEFGGGVLMFWGSLFLLRAAAGLAFSEFGVRDEAEAAIHVADMLIGPSWIWGGWKLFHHSKDHSVLGLSILFQATSLFLALDLLLLARPFLLKDNTLHEYDDILVVALMSLTVAVPFLWMYTRAISAERKVKKPLTRHQAPQRVLDYRHSA